MSLLSTVGSLFGWFQGQRQPSSMFKPSYDDVCQARIILKTLKLPMELVLQVLDHAQYWTQHTFVTSPEQAKIAAVHHGSRSSHATLCLDVCIFNNPTVNAICKGGEMPEIKSLEFVIVSRDQGWTSENTKGTFHTSSWVEASILRSVDDSKAHLPGPRFPNARLSDPSDFHMSVTGKGWFLVKRPESAKHGIQDDEGDFAWYLQGNRVGAGCDKYYVVWALNGGEGNEGAGKGEGFLHELKDGDRILVWARAKWLLWQCVVESVEVTVRYGF